MNRLKRCFMLVVVVGLPFAFSSCSEDDTITYSEQLQMDVKSIDAALATQGVDVVKDVYGLRMVIETLGTGLPANFSNTVKVKYKGTFFFNGVTFDEETTSYSVIPNASTNQWSVIDGWKIALTTLPEGSKAKIYVPSGLAYGPQAYGPIPANSILVFDIEILDVVRTAAYYEKIRTDSTAIDLYLDNKGLYDDAVKDSTGLRYIITQSGTGDSPSLYDKVKIKYTLRLLTDDTNTLGTGTIEPDANFYSRVVDYIDGLKIGLQKINKGTKATFYIPSGYAYGTVTSGTIPANSNLIFEIEL
ncbi:MAG TPA: FKBP-type peptidyl-prolyl cis-trans isomerase, partial [Chryseolinea sp.]|nr:FKBP-type peptidyl-prolyl cis-trans isomerase [Chryseolinea sp.]